jgi:two-component system OmpR family response regulator
MRLLSYNIAREIIEDIEHKELYIIDKAEDINDALYHLQVRFYNLVLVYENDIKNCVRMLGSTFNSNTAYVIISDNATSKFELKCFKNGALDVIKAPVDRDLLMARLETIHRDNFREILDYEGKFVLNKEYKDVFDINNRELSIRGKAYDVLNYLIQNRHRPPISKDELIYALWEDPEMVCQNIIEVNINQIRTKLKKQLGLDLIDTIRNRGYKLRD